MLLFIIDKICDCEGMMPKSPELMSEAELTEAIHIASKALRDWEAIHGSVTIRAVIDPDGLPPCYRELMALNAERDKRNK